MRSTNYKGLYLVTVPSEWAGDCEFSWDGDNFESGSTISLGIFKGTRREIKNEIMEQFGMSYESEDQETGDEDEGTVPMSNEDIDEFLENLVFYELAQDGDHDVAIFM